MILVTGCAGFIGFNLCNRLSLNGHIVVGIDNVSKDSSLKIKFDRLSILRKSKNFKFSNFDISNKKKVENFFKGKSISLVIHLAAIAGVRESMRSPEKYFTSNLSGFFNVIETAKNHKIKKFIYASSSSVYDKNAKAPFKENDSTDEQISFYAYTKKK